MTHNDEDQLTERMNSLAGELAGLYPSDPRRPLKSSKSCRN